METKTVEIELTREIVTIERRPVDNSSHHRTCRIVLTILQSIIIFSRRAGRI